MIERLLRVRREFYEKNELLFSLESKLCFEELKLNEIHCIYFTEIIEKPNITSLANRMDMTTSGLTKITTRLVKKGYLGKYQLEVNKKEVYFHLTEKGRNIYNIHEKLHKEGDKRDYDFLSNFPKEELKIIINFFEKNNNFLDDEIGKVIKNK